MPKTELYNDGNSSSAINGTSGRRDGQRLEHLITAKIARLGVAVEVTAASVYERRFGVKNHELKVLNVLAYSDPISIADLSRRAHVDKAWVSRSVAGLVKRGFVQKWQNSTDARSSLVQLTPSGVTLVKKLSPTMFQREDALLVGLDKDLVCWILDTLLERLERMKE